MRPHERVRRPRIPGGSVPLSPGTFLGEDDFFPFSQPFDISAARAMTWVPYSSRPSCPRSFPLRLSYPPGHLSKQRRRAATVRASTAPDAASGRRKQNMVAVAGGLSLFAPSR